MLAKIAAKKFLPNGGLKQYKLKFRSVDATKEKHYKLHIKWSTPWRNLIYDFFRTGRLLQRKEFNETSVPVQIAHYQALISL